jgi:uncharacterized protein YwgA
MSIWLAERRGVRMDARLVTLKLVLDKLGIPAAITTLDERKEVQKAVYLAQASGTDLGYRYSWYERGPYSPRLAQDYYSLADAIAAHDNGTGERQLRPEVAGRLERVLPLLQEPTGVSLTRAEWLELLASLHYLLINRRLSAHEAKKVLEKEKGDVAPFTTEAERALSNARYLESSSVSIG